MGIKVKLDPKTLKKIEAEVQRKLDAAQKKNPVPADATPAQKKRAVEKIAKAAAKMK